MPTKMIQETVNEAENLGSLAATFAKLIDLLEDPKVALAANKEVAAAKDLIADRDELLVARDEAKKLNEENNEMTSQIELREVQVAKREADADERDAQQTQAMQAVKDAEVKFTQMSQKLDKKQAELDAALLDTKAAQQAAIDEAANNRSLNEQLTQQIQEYKLKVSKLSNI